MRRVICSFLVLSLVGCASTTTIRSQPSGARVYLDGEYVGETPYAMSDRKIVGSSTEVKLVHDGYRDFATRISRDEEVDVGALIGGIFFLIPLLWVEGYKGTHTYELEPATTAAK